jgi:hypothetical protein
MQYQTILVGWLKRTKDGKPFISLKAERDIKAGESIALFKNDKGGVETRPDYRAYEKIEDQYEVVKPQQGSTAQKIADDIPF